MTAQNRIKQAVILCAGLGTRLRPLTDNTPKVMIDVGGRPLLVNHLDLLRQHGITEIFINLHYMPTVIESALGDGSRFDVSITYAHEPEIRGTAGGVKNFESELDEDFFVLYGDMYSHVNYTAMADAYFAKKNANKNCVGMEIIGPTSHPEDSDLVVVDHDDRFTQIFKKPHSVILPNPESMQAMFIFNKKIVSAIPANSYYEIDHQLLPHVMSQGFEIFGWRTNDYLKDIGTMERYNEVNEYAEEINSSAGNH